MSFATLALIALVGLLGPLLATPPGWPVPVVLGELAAGIVVGPTGLDRLHPHDPTFSFLAAIGFALVMFVAGSHVPIRDPRITAAIRVGTERAVGVGVTAAALGALIAWGFDTGHPALYAVLLASSSAALVLPILDTLEVSSPHAIELLPQVAIADTACIVALPLAIEPAHAGRAALGSLAVIAAAVLAFVVLRSLERSGLRKRAHHVSEERKYALELRVSLVILFALAALATRTHVSIMLAGFSFGIAVAAVGEPRRLAHQLFALTEGFLGPLFFIWVGASLNLRDLGSHPSAIALGAALGSGAVVAHVVMRASAQPAPFGALAAAQLGVPVAAVTIGTSEHLFKSGEAVALILGALVTIVVATVSAQVLTRQVGGSTPPPPTRATEQRNPTVE